jgi:hypothetical protein
MTIDIDAGTVLRERLGGRQLRLIELVVLADIEVAHLLVLGLARRGSPARHGRDVGLHWGVAVALRDLRVAAREESRFAATCLRGPCCAVFARRGGMAAFAAFPDTLLPIPTTASAA